jgi:CheY-specific phosphatase CheX
MAVKFFGHFLVKKGVVSREAILAAFDIQEQKNLKLGEMAVSMGYITQSDIDLTHNAQFFRDMKLGDLLVEMGIMNINQLNEVITRQKETHLYIGEALVLVGFLTREQLQHHLNEFKLDQAPYVSDRIELPAGIANSKIWETAADLTYKMITRVLDLQFRTERGHIVTTLRSNLMMAALDLSGDVEARFILSVSAGVQKMVAKAILHEESVENETTEILEDTVMEFVNVVCGNIAAKSSQMGQLINISPPVTIHPPAAGIPVPDGHIALCFPIHVGDGEKMELLLLIRQ